MIAEETGYQKYQHVEKLGNTEVEGILFGKVYVFPKIDGTNAHVWREDGTVKAGSRNRELSLDNDNAGFCAYVLANLDKFNKLFDLLPDGAHVYGEWLVPHSLKTYRQPAWREFYVFDVLWGERHLWYEEYQSLVEEAGLNYVPPIRIINNPTEENINRALVENIFLIEDGAGVGEGVVLKNYDFTNRYGRQTWAKVITSEFKEKHHKAMGAPVSNGSDHVEEKVVNRYVTEALVDKVHANIVNDSDGWSSKHIPRLLHTVFYDLVREHAWDIVKDFKNPTINYKTLLTFCNLKVKQIKADLF
jgi:ATP-dependent RNA circularization protein (DNA/RNA ligase family)